MLKKLGAVFFFSLIVVAALLAANVLALLYYDKPLVPMIRDLLFLATRK